MIFILLDFKLFGFLADIDIFFLVYLFPCLRNTHAPHFCSARLLSFRGLFLSFESHIGRREKILERKIELF